MVEIFDEYRLFKDPRKSRLSGIRRWEKCHFRAKLILSCIMLKNGQTYFKNLWPFFKIMCESVNYFPILDRQNDRTEAATRGFL